MTVTALTLDGQSTHSSLEAAGSVLRVELPQALAPGTPALITFEFTVRLPLEMSGNYGLFGSFDGLLVLKESYPIIPVFDKDGWDLELPVEHGDITHLDASFSIVRVTLPANLQVIASGVELDRVDQGEWQSVTFAAGPVREFYLAAAQRFQRSSTTLGETTINSYVLPGAEKSEKTILDHTTAALTLFNQHLMPYPYTELDFLSTPMQAYGMEYPGVIALNIKMYDPEDLISGVPAPIFLESTTVHEAAHQWFYNLVGNDQLEAPWLDEAIAQYLTGIYYLERYGEQAYRSYRQSWIERWDLVEQQPTPIGLPAASYDARAYGALIYGRGPLFIEALAEKLGEETFWTFMRSYVQLYQWDIAHPEDFIGLAEETCACKLDDLWEIWGVYP
ncbi:MAG: M1 family peptidase [Anaerolineales bacterium]|nr:MAG: M1 family peptidase [Anaerolineales bacterium]